ncbi:MAG: hypothetical protein AABY30_02960 [Candidatus Thermoplasmatota archaeon]
MFAWCPTAGRTDSGRAQRELTSGRGPMGVAAATAVTIRNQYEELRERLGIRIES